MRPPEHDLDACAGRVFQELLRRAHVTPPAAVGPLVAELARGFGATRVVAFLVDYEQRSLVPVPSADAEGHDVASMVGTVAGRAYTASTIVEVEAPDGGVRLFVPLLDGTVRLGVMEVTFSGLEGPVAQPLLALVERYTHLVALLVVAKNLYTDFFEMLRRRETMSVAGELIWSLEPPLVLATEDFVLAAMLEPCYDNGGDAFDYALDDGVLHLAVFDAMGHGLPAAGDAAFALSLARHCRRCGHSLEQTYEEIDSAIAAQHGASRYVTALLVRLEVETGELTWVSAGHPPPLLLRDGHVVKTLDLTPATPMGLVLESSVPAVGSDQLQPGDMVVLYTDGLTEARRPGGELFTVERLAEFIEREAASGQPAPETLRRLREAIIGRGEGALHDDATALLVEWRRGSEHALMPQTVLD